MEDMVISKVGLLAGGFGSVRLGLVWLGILKHGIIPYHTAYPLLGLAISGTRLISGFRDKKLLGSVVAFLSRYKISLRDVLDLINRYAQFW